MNTRIATVTTTVIELVDRDSNEVTHLEYDKNVSFLTLQEVIASFRNDWSEEESPDDFLTYLLDHLPKSWKVTETVLPKISI